MSPAGSAGSCRRTAPFITPEVAMPTGSMYPAIVRLLRPQFALTGLVLYGVGALYATQPWWGAVPLDRLAPDFLCVLAGHLAINAANDYFDREDDRFGTPTRFSGGSGVLVTNPALAPVALGLAVGLSVASLLGAVFFSAFYGPNPWFVGLTAAALATGWSYSTPPVRLRPGSWARSRPRSRSSSCPWPRRRTPRSG